MEVFRRYINKRNNKTLIVDEKEIVKRVRIIEMLKLPKDVNSITDKRIEYINDMTVDKKEIEDFIFILLTDLDKKLIWLFKEYYGSLPVYLYDLECYEADEKYWETIRLEEKLTECLKYKIKASAFMTKEFYQGIGLYDPEIPYHKERWQLVEKVKVS